MRKQFLTALFMISVLLVVLALSVSAEVVDGECGADASWTFNTETGALTVFGDGAIADSASGAATPWGGLSVPNQNGYR